MKGRDPQSTQTEARIYAYILGGICLRAGDRQVSDESNRSLKLWSVLCYLLLHRSRTVTQAELIETFWPEEDASAPLSALKMLILRIRTLLDPLLGEGVDPIVSHRGAYQWNPAIACEVDAERFEELCRRAERPGIQDKRRMELYRQAMELYKGDLLPKQSEQQWVVSLSLQYHAMYINAVKAYAALLEEAGQFEQMGELCLRASQMHPIDEQLHTLVIRSMLLQKKNAAALRHYQKVTKLLYDNLGVRPSEEMRQLYTKIMSEEKGPEEDLGAILQAISAESGPQGAFVCEYGFFEIMYRLEVRRARRSGGCLHVALLTLSSSDESAPPLRVLNTMMEQLQEIVVQNLRQSDVVSRYSKTQFIIMLPYANLEDSSMVMDRIVWAFQHQFRKSVLRISYKLKGLELD